MRRLGMDVEGFRKASARFNELFAFASEDDRSAIRGRNALRLYGWS